MIDTLTIALSSLGAAVLAGIVAHGAWQARRAGPKRADAGRPGGEPREPVMDDGNLPGEPHLDDATPGDMTFELPGAATERRAGQRRMQRLDALIDAIATLRIESPVAGAQVVCHLPTTRRAGGKPFAIEGLNADNGEWEPVDGAQRYGEFQAGVQLANRTGALNEIEYSEFAQKVAAFAEAVGALADLPDMLEAVASGRELDHFAAGHDAQLAVQLRASAAAWSVGYIVQQAARYGFLPGVVPGRLVMPAAVEGAPPVLTLTFDSQAALAEDPNLAAVRSVTLNFDVPQTPADDKPFAAWQTSAEALAAAMDAAIVDDSGRPLSGEGFDAIGRELERLYAVLEARDLPAGSPAAQRLFS